MKKSNEELRSTLENIQNIIKAKRYDEARELLESLDEKYDNPTVKAWLKKLDALAPKDPVADMQFPDVHQSVGTEPALSALDKGKKKNQPGCFRRSIRAIAISTLAVCGCLFAFAMIAPTPDPTPTKVSQITIPSSTPETSAQSQPSAIPTITTAPTQTPVPPTQAPVLPTQTPAPTSTWTQDEKAILVKTALVSQIGIANVQIADGRANGGERSIIVTYTSTATDEAELISEWGYIFGVVGGAQTDFNIDADTLSIIIGDSSGITVGIVVANMQDILDFIDGSITSDEFFSRLQFTDL